MTIRADCRARLHLEPLEDRLVMSSLPAIPSVEVTPNMWFPPPPPAPTGYSPSQIRHAYGFDQLPYNGAGQTIAIVDAYDDPYIVSDLQMFDRTFGLSDPPHFTKVAPEGVYSVDSGWAVETSLDVEWAHAIAPAANLLLVEAKSTSTDDLIGAVDYARKTAGVSVVSMSFGQGEFTGYWSNPFHHVPGETDFDGFFTTPPGHIGGAGLPGGVTFVASTGDAGAPAQYPAVSPNVLAVGGTTLTLDSAGNYLAETGWRSSGGGISAYESKPGYQSSVTQSSTQRTAPDVAYDADPSTGFAVYDSVGLNGTVGWIKVGGTSAGAPQWAALVALADQGRAMCGYGSLDGPSQTLPLIYAMPSTSFHDITSGYNGYYAGPGYDLVTGRGSPYANLVVQSLDFVWQYPNRTATSSTTNLSGSTISTTPLTQAAGGNLATPVVPRTDAFSMGQPQNDCPQGLELQRVSWDDAAFLVNTSATDHVKHPAGMSSEPLAVRLTSFDDAELGLTEGKLWEMLSPGEL
jgi:subtilase family serine protease